MFLKFIIARVVCAFWQPFFRLCSKAASRRGHACKGGRGLIFSFLWLVIKGISTHMGHIPVKGLLFKYSPLFVSEILRSNFSLEFENFYRQLKFPLSVFIFSLPLHNFYSPFSIPRCMIQPLPRLSYRDTQLASPKGAVLSNIPPPPLYHFFSFQ